MHPYRYERLWLVFLLALPLAARAEKAGPSRAAAKGCAWESAKDTKLGLEASVQRCDYGFRKIDFVFTATSLAIRYSDGGDKPEPLVDVLDLQGAETPEAGIARVFAAHTDKAIAARCQLVPYRGAAAPSGVKRFTFVPNAAYRKELKAKESPDEIPDPPCGDWGEAPDSIQYFEAQPETHARKILFVRLGQDEPLFDEATLRLLPPTR